MPLMYPNETQLVAAMRSFCQRDNPLLSKTAQGKGLKTRFPFTVLPCPAQQGMGHSRSPGEVYGPTYPATKYLPMPMCEAEEECQDEFGATQLLE